MLKKYLTAGLVGTALVAAPAFAQNTMTAPSSTSSTSSTTMSQDTMSHEGQWRASKLIGLNVYNDSNQSLGDINELLIDNTGKVAGVVIGVGGFLGVGEHNVAVAFDKLKWVNEPVASTTASNTAPATTTTRPGMTTGAATGTSTTSSSSSHSPWYPDHAVLSATKDQLKAMPAFKYSNK